MAAPGTFADYALGVATPQMYGTVTAGVDCLTQINAALAYLSSIGGGTLRLPYIGGYAISNTVTINFSNCYVLLEDDVTLTKTTKAAAFVFTGASRTSRISNVGIASVGRRQTINGNAAAMTGYTYSTSDTLYSCVIFQWADHCEAKNIYAYNALVNGIRSYQCSHVRFEDCDSSDILYDNGQSIDLEATASYSQFDPSTWSNSHILHPRSWNIRSGFGATAYAATNVKIIDLVAWNCGNDNLSLPVYGGGCSIEGDYFSYGGELLNKRCAVIRPKIFNCNGAGLFVTAVGTVAEDPEIDSTLAPVNRPNPTTAGGSNIYVAGAGTFKINRGFSRNAGTNGVFALAALTPFTATTVSGSSSITVTAAPAAPTIVTGTIVGAGIPAGTRIGSGPVGGGTGTYTLVDSAGAPVNATTSASGVSMTAASWPSIDWDGIIDTTIAGHGIYGRGAARITASPRSEFRLTQLNGYYVDNSGGSPLGAYNAAGGEVDIKARLFDRCGSRAGEAVSTARHCVMGGRLENCRRILGQGGQLKSTSVTDSTFRDIRNIDTGNNTTGIVQIDSACSRGAWSDVDGDLVTNIAKVTNQATTQFTPTSEGSVSLGFVAIADKVVAGTSTPTSLIGTGVGSMIIPGNKWTVGKRLLLDLSGILSTISSAPGNLTITVALGGTTLASVVLASLTASMANVPWQLHFEFTPRAIGVSGSMQPAGFFEYDAAASGRAGGSLNNGGAAVTIDTTALRLLDVTATWATSSGSNSITAKTAVFEIVN